MKRYNFDRRWRGKTMAEGIAVHAESMEEAEQKAMEIKGTDTDRIVFRDNRGCPKGVPCRLCNT